MSLNTGLEEPAQKRYKEQFAVLASAKAGGLIKPEQQTELDGELKRWRDEVGERLVFEADENADYGRQGFFAFESLTTKLKQLTSAGFVSSTQLAEIEKLRTKWRTEAAASLKSESLANTDFSGTGQAKFQDIGFVLTQMKAKGYMSAAQAAEIEKLQAKWSAEKAKADAKAEAERKAELEKAKKAQSQKPGTTPPKTTGSNPSSNQLNSNQLGTTGTTGR
jgi:hypothetical protein